MAAPSVHSGPAARPDDIDDLIVQVADLRRRVQNLEKQLGVTAEAPAVPVSTPVAETGLEVPRGIAPVLGRMLVAIAGAYVLRALTEWGVLPVTAGVVLGLAYGLLWLVIAARSPAQAKFAAAASCCTSVLVYAPLAWEATVRLKVMSTAASAGVLTAFALIALALAVKTPHRLIGTIATSSSVALALALVIARNDILPFATALLVIAASVETAAWRDLPTGVRAFAAVAADACILLFSALVSMPRGMPETWVAVAPPAVLAAQAALAMIYMATAVVQTVVRRRTLSFPEMSQTAAALLIGIGGAVWVFKDYRGIMLGLGLVALAGGIASYAASFLLFEHANKWNFRAWATFGLLLTLAGIALPFSQTGFWILCCGCAVLCCWTARRFQLPTLGLHGAVYLTVASAAGGATVLPFHVFFGSGGVAAWQSSIVIVAAGAAAWAAIAGISADGTGRWRNQLASLAIAGHIAWIIAGMASYAALDIWRMAAGAKNAPADTLGTVILTGLSLALAWAGATRGRRELVWLVYGFMALCAWKLAVRDFGNEHNFALVVSLVCYGGTLILLPRLLRDRSATGVS